MVFDPDPLNPKPLNPKPYPLGSPHESLNSPRTGERFRGLSGAPLKLQRALHHHHLAHHAPKSHILGQSRAQKPSSFSAHVGGKMLGGVEFWSHAPPGYKPVSRFRRAVFQVEGTWPSFQSPKPIVGAPESLVSLGFRVFTTIRLSFTLFCGLCCVVPPNTPFWL